MNPYFHVVDASNHQPLPYLFGFNPNGRHSHMDLFSSLLTAPPASNISTAESSSQPRSNRIKQFVTEYLKHHSPYVPSDAGVDLTASAARPNATAPVAGSPTDGAGPLSPSIRARSPPPCCAICLGDMTSKCFSDSCMHVFCFTCLLQWSQVKPECPLCKQSFCSIIHNIASPDKFDEHQVQPAHGDFSDLRAISEEFEHIIMVSRSHYSHQLQLQQQLRLPNAPTMRYLHPLVPQRFVNLFRRTSTDIERFAREYTSDVVPDRSSGSPFRTYVYRRFLYAMPLDDEGVEPRPHTPDALRSNPAYHTRLIAWVRREVSAILEPSTDVGRAVSLVSDLLLEHHLNTYTFQAHIEHLFRGQARHFTYELLRYAQSRFDMIGYDASVRLRTYTEHMDSVSMPGHAEQWMLPEERAAASRHASLTPGLSVLAAAAAADAERTSRANAAAGMAAARWRLPYPPSMPIPYVPPESVGNAAASEPMPSTSTGARGGVPPPETISLVDSDSSDNDVQFVRAQKPPHLRTPVMVDLDSASDSDVQFVPETPGVKHEDTPDGQHPLLTLPSTSAAAAARFGGIQASQNYYPNTGYSSSSAEEELRTLDEQHTARLKRRKKTKIQPVARVPTPAVDVAPAQRTRAAVRRRAEARRMAEPARPIATVVLSSSSRCSSSASSSSASSSSRSASDDDDDEEADEGDNDEEEEADDGDNDEEADDNDEDDDDEDKDDENVTAVFQPASPESSQSASPVRSSSASSAALSPVDEQIRSPAANGWSSASSSPMNNNSSSSSSSDNSSPSDDGRSVSGSPSNAILGSGSRNSSRSSSHSRSSSRNSSPSEPNSSDAQIDDDDEEMMSQASEEPVAGTVEQNGHAVCADRSSELPDDAHDRRTPRSVARTRSNSDEMPIRKRRRFYDPDAKNDQ